MTSISRFVIWICSRFDREQIEEIVNQLQEILSSGDPEIKPKDDFKNKHPNYRDFYVDPMPPLKKPPSPAEPKPTANWRELIAAYWQQHLRPLLPVRRRSSHPCVPPEMVCPNCEAPADYLYYNDGKKRSQVRCKVCGHLSQIHQRSRPTRKAQYWCPHCLKALFVWKKRTLETIYKCPNDQCPAYLKAKAKLNAAEKKLQKQRSSQFKLRYQYREYHFTKEHLQHSAPQTKVDLDQIHHSSTVLGLVLTFHISFALSARKTALILRQVFKVKLSYQTVLNYAEAAAYYCQRYNWRYKGEIDNDSAGDETYIRIQGQHAYTFFFISADNHKITAYHVAHSRETLPATIAMLEASRTAKPDQAISFITDGNPAYIAGLHFLNEQRKTQPPIEHHKVIALQNLDEESELYRRFKQIIERLNRTYKYHTRSANGFKSDNGAVAYTTLFVSHYNFLRPHMALGYRVPIPQADLDRFETIQEKWCRIIDVGKHLTDYTPNNAPVLT